MKYPAVARGRILLLHCLAGLGVGVQEVIDGRVA
jgi:hypothetical protein